MAYLTAEDKRRLKVSIRIQEAVKLPEDIFQIDSGGLIWMFDKEYERWISIDGSISKFSPKELKEKADALDAQNIEKYQEFDLWNKIRQDVLDRDNRTCQVCQNKIAKFHVHHILPRSCGGTNHADNLVTVCNKCHGRIEYIDIPKSARSKNDQDDW